MDYALWIMSSYIDVLLPVPLDALFTYSVPPSLQGNKTSI